MTNEFGLNSFFAENYQKLSERKARFAALLSMQLHKERVRNLHFKFVKKYF